MICWQYLLHTLYWSPDVNAYFTLPQCSLHLLVRSAVDSSALILECFRIPLHYCARTCTLWQACSTTCSFLLFLCFASVILMMSLSNTQFYIRSSILCIPCDMKESIIKRILWVYLVFLININTYVNLTFSWLSLLACWPVKVNNDLFKDFQIKESSGKVLEVCSYHVAHAQQWLV